MLRSTKRNSHVWGKIAATVIIPRGGIVTLRPISSSVLSKDQNDLGKIGFRSKTRIQRHSLINELF